MLLYHGTDVKYANDILKCGFVCKRSKKHWLGNGIYFYLDKDLADWWTTNPTNEFGTVVNDKAILEVEVSFAEEKVLDLRKLSNYLDCLVELDNFTKLAMGTLALGVEHDMKTLRCAFFDWIFDSFDYDCIIASFTHPEQAYLQSSSSEVIHTMRSFFLNYTETQVCVREGLIKSKSIRKCS